MIHWCIKAIAAVTNVKVHILRSTTAGKPPWIPVTTGEGLNPNIEFVEDTLTSNANELTSAELVYKIVVTYTQNNQTAKFIGPSIGIYGILSPREAKITRALMLSELRGMYLNHHGNLAGGGRLVVMFAPDDINGPIDSNYDPVSEQQLGDSQYGSPRGFVGGWATWMRITTEARNYATLEQTSTIIQDNQIQVRTLAFPFPKPDFVIVDPHTDERWVVGSKLDISYGPRGIVPYACDILLTKLQLNDLRYKIPVTMPDFPVYRT